MKRLLTKENLLSEKAIIAYFVAIKFIITLFPYEYGIFRDTFLYIAQSDHPGWGYLEVPPIAPLALALVRFLAGTTFFSLHIIQAVTGSLFIIITALMAKKLGGNKFAVILTLICATLTPQFIGTDAHFDYGTFDRLFWALALYSILLLIKTEDRKYWIYFGIAAGFGLLSKITMLYLGFGLLSAFLLLKERRYLFDIRFILSGLIALLIFLPFIIWQIGNGFPIIEYLINYQKTLIHTGAVGFFARQLATMNPIEVFIWLPGLYYFLFDREGKKYRVFGLAYLIISAIFIMQNAKYYLIAPLYSVLFAGGSIFLSGLAEKKRAGWLKPTIITVTLITSILEIPFARPLLPPELFIRYSGHNGNLRSEKNDTSELPQTFADQFGWEEMAQKVSGIYNSLSGDEKKKACIYADNYGEAGALHFYRGKYGYPDPVCPNNIFYFWGPGNNTGEIMIIVGDEEKDQDDLKQKFDSVVIADRIDNKYAMPFENRPIFLCRGLHVKLSDIWKRAKHFE